MPILTHRFVERQKPQQRPYEISCASLRGFMVRVLPSGKRSYFARVPEGGKHKRVRIGLHGQITFEHARARAAELLTVGRVKVHGMSASVAPPTRTLPLLRDFSRRYELGHIATHLKPATQYNYRKHLRMTLLPQFGACRLDEISLEDIERLHGSMGDRPVAANNAVRVLSHIYTKAIDWRVLPRGFMPPTRGLRLYKENRRERFLTPAERRRVEQVLERGLAINGANAPHRLHWSMVAVIRLLSLTGMRRGEVLGLTWDMVDRQHQCFRLPDSKTGQKVVPISTQVLDLLEELEERRDPAVPFVAYSRFKTAVSRNGIGRAWRRVREAAGIGDVRLHDLRHSAASDALMAGVPLAVVGKILGHRNPATTARYAHLSDDVLKQGVERMGNAIANARACKSKRKK